MERVAVKQRRVKCELPDVFWNLAGAIFWRFLKKSYSPVFSVIGVKRGESLGAGEDIQGVNPGLWGADGG